ncbi:GH1 family beta-glucosidase [Flavihumibacter profundi]|uniref:GH1 family beta-glucosidase n=1 Tax=Flavihumibacter profundi TaxID=2716883 RepID=UPI001CC42F2C|nr:GH1 family beta-glucosidase [Flavihumibacter profundi]MBZ5856659.1 beta-glucosidase [Flavihumibacter profundi]
MISNLLPNQFAEYSSIRASSFGDDFYFGVAISAAQNEGGWQEDGRSASIWDVFARRQGVIKNGARPSVACDFYHRFKDDLLLAKALGFNSFRFSISWSRVLPNGTGKVNEAGIRFYNDVIDECLRLGLTPFVTLYHWDLPQVLQKEGGWVNPLINHWFKHFTKICAKAFGDRVKHWIVLNEPVGFTSLGYILGKHAPGKKSLDDFLKTVHYAAIAQADGGIVLRQNVSNAHIGTAFSCSEVIPFSQQPDDVAAAKRIDLLMNRLFIEPLLGKGFPEDDRGLMHRMARQNSTWRFTERMQFDMDFIGLQNYFPVVVKHNPFIPLVQASVVKPSSRKVPHTAMDWEINPGSFHNIIKRFWKYGAIRELMITENGAAFKDKLIKGHIHDENRVAYFQTHLAALLQARKEGVKIKGYFAWTLMDNFEWSEGFEARFGLIHVDFKTQLRTIKNSGYWWRDFLTANA